MRILKLKTPVLALLLAIVALLLTLLFIPVMNFLQIDLLFWIFMCFYFPSELAVEICSSIDVKGEVPKPEFPFFIVFAFLQCYLIFFIGIGIYRRYHQKRKDEPAA